MLEELETWLDGGRLADAVQASEVSAALARATTAVSGRQRDIDRARVLFGVAKAIPGGPAVADPAARTIGAVGRALSATDSADDLHQVPQRVTRLQETVRRLDEDLKLHWRNTCIEAFKQASSLASLLERVPPASDLGRDLRRLSQAGTQLGTRFPPSSEDVAQFERHRKSVSGLEVRLRESGVTPAVRDFLQQASSPAGVRYSEVPQEALEWLAHNRAETAFYLKLS